MKTCKTCIIPDAYPKSDIDEHGVCAFCREFEAGDGVYGWKNEKNIKAMQKGFYKLVEGVKANTEGSKEPNVLVPMSGGKDSAYMAVMAFDLGLRPLFFTVDTGFHPEVAHQNLRHEVDRLKQLYGDFEHVVMKDDGLENSLIKGYRKQLLNPGDETIVRSVCYKCGPLIMELGMDVATRNGIPLVLEGYSRGQAIDFFFYKLPEDYYTMDHSNDWFVGEGFTEQDRRWNWNPARYPAGTEFPTVVAPFHVLPYDERGVVREVVKTGLIPSKLKAHPAFTNCDVNLVIMHAALKKDGFNPYRPEVAGLVREGIVSRTGKLALFNTFDTLVRVGLGKKKTNQVLEKLDLTMEDLVG